MMEWMGGMGAWMILWGLLGLALLALIVLGIAWLVRSLSGSLSGPSRPTTEQGLARSTDGGRTFTTTGTPAPLLLVDWPVAELLVAVDTSGSVYRSVDGGASWVRQGAVRGVPEALATYGASEVYIAAGDGVYASRDGGRTFTLRQSMA